MIYPILFTIALYLELFIRNRDNTKSFALENKYISLVRQTDYHTFFLKVHVNVTQKPRNLTTIFMFMISDKNKNCVRNMYINNTQLGPYTKEVMETHRAIISYFFAN